MTMYSIEPEKTLRTVREALVEQVAPALESSTALNALAGVVEHLDNLLSRVDWDTRLLGRAIEDTESLARQLGLGPAEDNSVSAETLRRRRREIRQVTGTAYERDDVATASIVAAVLEFSETDVPQQISVGLRSSIPDFGRDTTQN